MHSDEERELAVMCGICRTDLQLKLAEWTISYYHICPYKIVIDPSRFLFLIA